MGNGQDGIEPTVLIHKYDDFDTSGKGTMTKRQIFKRLVALENLVGQFIDAMTYLNKRLIAIEDKAAEPTDNS